MSVDFTQSETESAVEALVSKQNGHEKTIQDAIDVVLAVNHDSINRDSEILRAQKRIIEVHLVDCHANDREINYSYKIAKWAVGIAVAALIVFGVTTYTEDHGSAEGSVPQPTTSQTTKE